MNDKILNVGIIGCGLIGTRRARVAENHSSSTVCMVADIDKNAAKTTAAETKAIVATADEIIDNPEIDVVIIATPNQFMKTLSCAAMKNNKHVLIEKPMGCHYDDAREMLKISNSTHRRLKIGFNHRYHSGLQQAKQIITSGEIGEIINIRAHYGHGGRPGYENEWRGDAALAGGGELTDQGVHVIDLIHWILGKPSSVYCAKQTAVWPIYPLEDNAFAILHFESGAIAQFHTSWTQWKNQFCFDVFGTLGSVSVNGLGGSYGVETFTKFIRNIKGGIPATEIKEFTEPDLSWEKEWSQFVLCLQKQTDCYNLADESIHVMETLTALYESSNTQKIVIVGKKHAVH